MWPTSLRPTPGTERLRCIMRRESGACSRAVAALISTVWPWMSPTMFMWPPICKAISSSSPIRQIECGVAIADPAAIFSGDDLQAQGQAGFDAPILTIGLKHLLGTHLGCRTGAEEVFGSMP